VLGLEAGLQDQAAVLVMTANLRVAARVDFPAAILGVAQQCRETCIGIETRRAEPVDRTVATDQRSRAHVADHRVVFDLAGHQSSDRAVMAVSPPEPGLGSAPMRTRRVGL